MDFTRSLVTDTKGITMIYLCIKIKTNYVDSMVLTALEISALKVRVFGKK